MRCSEFNKQLRIKAFDGLKEIINREDILFAAESAPVLDLGQFSIMAAGAVDAKLDKEKGLEDRVADDIKKNLNEV